jgi:hypothetical protein
MPKLWRIVKRLLTGKDSRVKLPRTHVVSFAEALQTGRVDGINRFLQAPRLLDLNANLDKRDVWVDDIDKLSFKWLNQAPLRTEPRTAVLDQPLAELPMMRSKGYERFHAADYALRNKFENRHFIPGSPLAIRR